MNMQPGDRVKWGTLHGVVVSHVRTTEPFEPKDRCFVRFDGGFHEWVDTSRLSKLVVPGCGPEHKREDFGP